MAGSGGFLLYLRQEGRGIGLYAKLDAYVLQDDGLDTYEANLALGYGEDERDYTIAAQMLLALGQSRVALLSNNPDKAMQLGQLGVTVSERVPTACTSRTPTRVTWRPRSAGALTRSTSGALSRPNEQVLVVHRDPERTGGCLGQAALRIGRGLGLQARCLLARRRKPSREPFHLQRPLTRAKPPWTRPDQNLNAQTLEAVHRCADRVRAEQALTVDRAALVGVERLTDPVVEGVGRVELHLTRDAEQDQGRAARTCADGHEPVELRTRHHVEQRRRGDERRAAELVRRKASDVAPACLDGDPRAVGCVCRGVGRRDREELRDRGPP